MVTTDITIQLAWLIAGAVGLIGAAALALLVSQSLKADRGKRKQGLVKVTRWEKAEPKEVAIPGGGLNGEPKPKKASWLGKLSPIGLAGLALGTGVFLLLVAHIFWGIG